MTTIEATKPISVEENKKDEGITILQISIYAVFGLLLSTLTLPFILPGLIASTVGDQPKVFWYLSRGTATASFLFLWLSMVLGLLITSKTAKFYPGAFTANDLHQFVSIAGLLTGTIHAVLLLGDQYFKVNITHLLIPFSISTYRPIWVGVGQLAFYIWVILVGSFYLKKQIGYKAWRALHLVSFLIFAASLAHGITSGTDTSNVWMQGMYWVSGGSILMLTIYRMLAKVVSQE